MEGFVAEDLAAIEEKYPNLVPIRDRYYVLIGFFDMDKSKMMIWDYMWRVEILPLSKSIRYFNTFEEAMQS